MWLEGLTDAGQDNHNLRKIARAMRMFRSKLNEISQNEELFGDKSLHVNQEEIQIARYNGASNKPQSYSRHKDSYKRDKNNEVDGLELRKLTMVIFLNEDLD